jgi:NAD(P)-dependent dehydrogenase (short-subunit alcohol dehydrogenase family)
MADENTTPRLHGKVALVTGGYQGIGRGIVEEFRNQGAIVVCADLQCEDDGETERRLDVTDEQGWRDVVSDIVRRHGRIDVLVNNAGGGSAGPAYPDAGAASLHEIAREAWDRIVAINQLSTYLGIKAIVPAMLAQHSGSIVNMSSIFGARGVDGQAAYQASKAAVLGITRNAAVTYAPAGIRVNAIVPGWIRTPANETQPADVTRRILADTPMGRGGQPSDIAWAATYLAADESQFVTGVELPVDGGYLAR